MFWEYLEIWKFEIKILESGIWTTPHLKWEPSLAIGQAPSHRGPQQRAMATPESRKRPHPSSNGQAHVRPAFCGGSARRLGENYFEKWIFQKRNSNKFDRNWKRGAMSPDHSLFFSPLSSPISNFWNTSNLWKSKANRRQTRDWSRRESSGSPRISRKILSVA